MSILRLVIIVLSISFYNTIVYSKQNKNDNLLEAIILNDETAVCKYLYDSKLDQNELNPECPPNTICKPIYFAVKNSSIKIISLLVDSGADINSANGYSGDTPLIIAISNNRPEVVKFLVKKGADVNKANRFGITPFWGLCAKGNFELTNFIIDKADINFPGKIFERIDGKQKIITGVTPLMISAKNGHLDIVELLLKNGAKIRLKDSLGRSVLEYARFSGLEILKILEKNG